MRIGLGWLSLGIPSPQRQLFYRQNVALIRSTSTFFVKAGRQAGRQAIFVADGSKIHGLAHYRGEIPRVSLEPSRVATALDGTYIEYHRRLRTQITKGADFSEVKQALWMGGRGSRTCALLVSASRDRPPTKPSTSLAQMASLNYTPDVHKREVAQSVFCSFMRCLSGFCHC